MQGSFADRLLAAIAAKNAPVCVGLDPVVERFPRQLLKDSGVLIRKDGSLDPLTRPEAVGQALLAFGTAVIDRVGEYVPALKINIAFFEPHYAEGTRVYFELVRRAQRAGLLVIGDVKRSDVGHSCSQYAMAHLGGMEYRELYSSIAPDAITINPLLGRDGVEPFVSTAVMQGKGVFALVQTSNPSAVEVQGLRLSDGSTVSERLAELVEGWAAAEAMIGRCGYSSLGAVVAPTDPVSTARLRALMPHCVFLVPGYGAQGRSANEILPCFKRDGTGAIVNASRSVIFAFADAPYRERFGDDWRGAMEQSCRDFSVAIRSVLNERP